MAKFTGHTITSDSASGSAEIERSLKFHDGDSANLTRTPGSAGNRKTFTYSCWFKRSTLGTQSGAFLRAGSASSNYFKINIANDHKLYVLATISGSYVEYFRSYQLFRDVAGWTHLVLRWDTTDSTAAQRVRVYINGSELAASRSSNPTEDLDGFVNNTVQHEIGSDSGNSQYWDGYIAEANLVDGLSLDPSSFGFTGGQTNVWLPRRYTGSYGTNGFRLDFNDNSSTAALGIDKSPNGNDFAVNNFSVSSGVGDDSVIDSPTNNFCTFTPLKTNPSARITYTEGNLQHNGVSGNNHLRSTSTMSVSSGKWYLEVKFISGYETADNTVSFGFQTDNAGHRASNNDAVWYQNDNDYKALTYGNNGNVYFYNASSSTTLISGLQTFANGDVMGIALDLDNNKMFVSKNGTFFSNSAGTQDPVTGAYPLISGSNISDYKNRGWNFTVSGYSDQVVTADFGQHGFAYTPPKGFKAISSKNFVPSTPAFRNPKRHFDIVTFTGNGTSGHSISGLEFKPDFVWIKNRSGTYYHNLSDTVRGITRSVNSNANDAEVNYSNILAVHDHGFVVGGSELVNKNSQNLVAWCWKAGGAAVSNTDGDITSSVSVNEEAGFSIATYTGTYSSGSNSATTIGHGLGKVPKWALFKKRSGSGNWMVYHEGLGNTHNYYLNTSDTSQDDAHAFFDTSPTSSVFTFGISGFLNASSETYVAYFWTDVPGFSKFGSYVGNGDNDGTFVNLGFRPAYILIKRNASESWIIADFKRNSNDRTSPADSYLLADTTGAESTGIIYDLVQNGVRFASTSQNESGSVYHYAAFADSPGITPFGGATANAQ